MRFSRFGNGGEPRRAVPAPDSRKGNQEKKATNGALEVNQVEVFYLTHRQHAQVHVTQLSNLRPTSSLIRDSPCWNNVLTHHNQSLFRCRMTLVSTSSSVLFPLLRKCLNFKNLDKIVFLHSRKLLSAIPSLTSRSFHPNNIQSISFGSNRVYLGKMDTCWQSVYNLDERFRSLDSVSSCVPLPRDDSQ